MKLTNTPDCDVTMEDIFFEENVLLLNEGIERGRKNGVGKEREMIPYTLEQKKLIKDIFFEGIFNYNIKQATKGEPLLANQEIKGYIHYGIRTIERWGPEGLSLPYISPTEGVRKGAYEEKYFEEADALGKMLFQNLEEELDRLIEEHGETIRNILLAGEKMVFICTHPSLITLPVATLILKKVQKKYGLPAYVENNNMRVILAAATITPIKELGSWKLHVKELIKGMGIDVLLTIPDNPEMETDSEIKALGDKSRVIAARNLVAFSREEGTTLSIAPEGTTTPIENGKYKLKTLKKGGGTEGSLYRLGVKDNKEEKKRKHFILLGMGKEDMEKGEELKPTNIKMRMETLSPENLSDIAEKEGNDKTAFSTTIMKKLANLVGGEYQGSTASSEERS